jgi:RHS repeat-associated protein
MPSTLTIQLGGDEKMPFRLTGKEKDDETGFTNFGARLLDAKTSRWLSVDPAMGEYIPFAPVDDEARKYNQNLPGLGGIYNTVNANPYQYAGNNPVKYVDPDGEILENNTSRWVYVVYETPKPSKYIDEHGEPVRQYGEWVAPHSRYPAHGDARIDGVIAFDDNEGIVILKVSGGEKDPIIDVSISEENGRLQFSKPFKFVLNLAINAAFKYIYKEMNKSSKRFNDMEKWVELLLQDSAYSSNEDAYSQYAGNVDNIRKAYEAKKQEKNNDLL